MKKLPLFIFVLGILLLLTISQIGIDHTLSELHSFRQTQTAITTFYFIQDGLKLDYITPVLGAPWTIPFEFPFYQGMVALFQKISSLPLDMSGRIVSLLFTLFCIFIFKDIMRQLKIFSSYSWVLLILFWLNPLWLYWSRTFMIESTAVAFSALFWLGNLKHLNNTSKNTYWIIIAVIAGSLGALIKITTFFVFFFIVAIQVFIHLYNSYISKNDSRSLINKTIVSFMILATPVLLFYFWMGYSDGLKSLNFLGSTQTSSALRDWNMGTFDQKSSLNCWVTINRNSGHLMAFSIAITLLGFLLNHPQKQSMFLSTLAGIAGPMVFTNLYFVHDYYSFANTPMYILTIVLFTNHYFHTSIWKGWVIWSIMSIYGLMYYYSNYFTYQVYNNKAMQKAAAILEKNTSPSDIIFLKEKDWSPEMAYYAKRKVIALPKQVLEKFDIEPKLILDRIDAPKVDAFLLFSDNKKLRPSEQMCLQYYGLDSSFISIHEDYVHAKLYLKDVKKSSY